MKSVIALCIFVKTVRLKKLDWLIIRTFFGPFILTFFIAVFVLVMIFLWRFVEDLASKGLDLIFVVRLLFYASATTVPMALPISVLLSSIMTMGSFAENLELVAAKSSGVGLYRSMRPLFFAALAVSIFGFVFANNLLPVASFRLRKVVTEISRKMPALDIQEGAYYDGLKGFTLMVDKKAEDQKSFQGLIVYDHTENTGGAENIIKAANGDIAVSDDGNLIILNLYNGVRYSDFNFYSRKQKGTPFSRELFREQHIFIDISELNKKNSGSTYIGNQYTMMTVGQLNKVKKEIVDEMKSSASNFYDGFYHYYAFMPEKKSSPQQQKDNMPFNTITPTDHPQVSGPEVVRDSTIPYRAIPQVSFGPEFLKIYTEQERKAIVATSINQLAIIKGGIEQQMSNTKMKKSNLVKNRIEFHKKFTLAVACLLLFFIGAPLGAIIKKGGLGLPLIFSIIIFIIYYVVSTIFEKSVRSMSLDLYGLWISSMLLLPFGIFLTIKASMESSIFNFDTYLKPLKRIFGRSST